MSPERFHRSLSFVSPVIQKKHCHSVWECNGHFDHWFSNIKHFLCGVWNLHKEKLYPEDFSMNTASNSSVERCVVNGRNAMAKRP